MLSGHPEGTRPRKGCPYRSSAARMPTFLAPPRPGWERGLGGEGTPESCGFV